MNDEAATFVLPQPQEPSATVTPGTEPPPERVPAPSPLVLSPWVGAGSGSPPFPKPGEEIAGFRLLSELGRGALGRVFLASQPALADRPVVLKVTPIRGGEHRSLARLQHTHIVPLLSAQDLPDRGLRLICLPSLGGASMDRVLDGLTGIPRPIRRGRDILEILDRNSVAVPDAMPPAGPARAFLATESYERSICWIGLCLAEALQHAHRRGLVHLDLKPANVLLAADGMPFLLDFHLAQPPIGPDRPRVERLGGTPSFMAPEQRQAVEAVRTGAPIPCKVDARADLYALGAFLYKALADEYPGPGRHARRLRRANPRVGLGLADIVARCLADEPGRRYPDAASLADDLRRHLDRRALRGVRNRSLSERWDRWRRARPLVFAKAGALGLAGLGIGSTLLALGIAADRRRLDAEVALRRGRLHLQAAAPIEAEADLRHGLDLLDGGPPIPIRLPGTEALRRTLSEELGHARLTRRATELHALADRLRFLFDADPAALDAARSLERRLAEVWADRAEIEREFADGPDAEQVRADLLDLAILRADLRVRLATGRGRAEARREALRILDEAEALWGPSPVLDLERQAHGGPPAKSAPIAPRTPWEWYALGRARLRAGDLDAAARALDRASELDPTSLWPQFTRGLCALRRGQPAEALDAFGACVALAPSNPACYRNRAIAFDQLGARDRARRDVETALRLENPPTPTPGPADRPD